MIISYNGIGRNLQKKRLPLMVRLAHGSSPVGLKSTQPFLPELRSFIVACRKTMAMMANDHDIDDTHDHMMMMMMMVMMMTMTMVMVRLLQRVEEDALIAFPLTKGFQHHHRHHSHHHHHHSRHHSYHQSYHHSHQHSYHTHDNSDSELIFPPFPKIDFIPTISIIEINISIIIMRWIKM